MRAEIRTNPEEAAFARLELLSWYWSSARRFPWREERDPYRILMAEMMLRRTRASQVVEVYRSFIAKYPDAAALDSASAAEVAEDLRPLGLYWRAANFKKLAEELVSRHSGSVPGSREELLQLTGVGPYVADAVRCFAFVEPVALVDTNTVRVAARYFGFEYNQESRRRPAVIAAVSELVDTGQPQASNYALLDFAATVCRALNPEHAACPLRSHCRHFQHTTGESEPQERGTEE
jgi:A/G-specific adenine glycosylase